MSAIESSTKKSYSKEQRIRELAYQIWETEGRPDGQEARHWELANKLAEADVREEPAPAKRSPSARKPRAAKTGATNAEVPNAANKLRDTTTTDT